ncbi:MAG: hypothetical protein LLF96_10680 [Eubacteriales bacterium]|nr:hypothetical protein [Eubacteriales bacterium]
MTDWLMVILTAFYVGATILICIYNLRSTNALKEQTAELKRQFDEENRPYITTELIYEKRSFYALRFTNQGKRIANHVRIQLDKEFLDSINEVGFLSSLEKNINKECIIGVGNCYNLFFASNEIHQNHNKPLLSGRISYSDGKETYYDEFQIDLDSYATFFSVNSESEDILNEMKKQTKELEKIQKALSAR